MDQKKIGTFLKTLRNEKGITQEQLAEKMYVAPRTVSRWETGSNLPDLSVLVELADFYKVDIRELINGERRCEKMNNETKDTLSQVAQYAEQEKKKLKKKMLDMSIAASLLLLFATVLKATDGFGYIPQDPCDSVVGFCTGVSFSVLVLNALHLAGLFEKIYAAKMKIKNKQSENSK